MDDMIESWRRLVAKCDLRDAWEEVDDLAALHTKVDKDVSGTDVPGVLRCDLLDAIQTCIDEMNDISDRIEQLVSEAEDAIDQFETELNENEEEAA